MPLITHIQNLGALSSAVLCNALWEVIYINYVIIPKDLIYKNDIGDNRIAIYSYLCCKRSLDDTVAFSVNGLAHWQNKRPDKHKGRINDRNLNCLQRISELGYFINCPDFSNISKLDNYYSIELDIEKFDTPEYFGIIYFDEIYKILHFKEILNDSSVTGRINSDYLFLLLSYIRSNTYHRKPQQTIDSNPECCYRMYQIITEDIAIQERTLPKLLNVLSLLGIIKSKEVERYNDGNNWHTRCKVFADIRRFRKDSKGNVLIDENYNADFEIESQIKLLHKQQIKTKRRLKQIENKYI